MKNSSKVLVTAGLLLLLTPLIVYGMILIIDKIILSNFSNVIVEGSKDAWIGFSGSLIGGLITMLSLYFTILSENEKTKKDKAKSVRPFIVCKPQFNRVFLETIDENTDSCQYPISLVVENISNNLVKDLKLEKENVYEFNEETKKFDLDNQDLIKFNNTNYCIYTILLDDMEMIKPNSSFAYQTNFLIYNYKNELKSSGKCFKVVAYYKYRDILDIIEYTHKLEYELHINYTRDGDFNLCALNISNKTIKEEYIGDK